MFKLPVHTWIINAAAVLSRRYGGVTRQARHLRCSRQTAYQHARKVERRLTLIPPECAELQADNHRLRQEVDELKRQVSGLVPLGKTEQRKLAATAFAMGVSLRQIENLLALLLPAEQVPDHSTLGHWIQAQADRAGAVLRVLDAACAPRARTLAVDEVFFGGGRPWLQSNRRA
jgi:hypothetical protein